MTKYFNLLALLIIVFASCKKEVVNKSSTLQDLQNGANKNAQAALSSITSPTFTVADNGDGTFTATLQPDSANGQDVFVDKLDGSSDYANSNSNWQPELDVAAWTINGSPLFIRSYLRFVDLANIPSTAHVLSATLYLYGVSSSIASPQGNSTYPGSPYTRYGANTCIIEPATGAWDESTVTWNTQPGISDKLKVFIPKSTSQWNYDVTLSDVKGMVARAVKYPDNNYGVRISLAQNAYYRCIVFASSEASDPTKRPKLVVTYSN